MNYVTALAAIVALLFAGSVFDRYRVRGGAHLALWAFGALLFGVGVLAESLLSVGYVPVALKAWYLTGAMLTAPWLGQGTVALLVKRRNVAPTLTAILLVVSLLCFELVRRAAVLDAPFDPGLPVAEQYRSLLDRNGLMVFFTIVLNIYGTLALVGGALYSVFIFWRKRVMRNRMLGNIFIALGGMLPASGGSGILVGAFDWHSWSLLLGVVALYIGYVWATTPDADEG
ncbi:MAG: hypothetical protein EPO32_10950 [Anaerolineae bacterium]|nr:MAG: hypothetical protein EPO32_10950 [Anaerolineae bacterium]